MLGFVYLFVPLFMASTAVFASDGGCAYNSERTKLARVVAIDSTSADQSQIGIKAIEPKTNRDVLELKDHEVVLVFDNGPQSPYTKYILDILDHHCVKASFFLKGQAALADVNDVKDIVRRGHTIGGHGWSSSAPLPLEDVKIDIEKGFDAIKKVSGVYPAPFYRFGEGQDSPDARSHLMMHNISIWSVDILSGDTDNGLTASKLANRTIERVQQAGKGIILFHDTRKVTVDALDSILYNLEQSKFKVVHIVPRSPYVPDSSLEAKITNTISIERDRDQDRPVKSHKRPTTNNPFIELARQQIREDRTIRNTQASEQPSDTRSSRSQISEAQRENRAIRNAKILRARQEYRARKHYELQQKQQAYQAARLQQLQQQQENRAYRRAQLQQQQQY